MDAFALPPAETSRNSTHALVKSDYLFFEGTKKAPRPGWVRPSLSAPSPSPVVACETYPFFRSLLGYADLPVAHYRQQALMRRTAACLRTLGVTSVDEALISLRKNPQLAEVALNTALLGVTEFFRDRAVFELLRFSVLPALVSQGVPLRIWSAACSEGQELYSVALLLAEEGQLAGCELLGTDCRADAIRQAKLGIFAAEQVAQLDAHWRQNFFTENQVSARIDPEIIRALKWRTADLFARIEPGPWHVILWRNMAIYLEPFAALPIWQKLVAELRPGGYLITGKADHPPASLNLERIASCIYRKPAERI